MRVSGKKQDSDRQNNGLLWSTDFQRIKSKYISKLRKKLYRNKDNNSTYFTFSILFAKYKREEVEIRNLPSCYDKNQLPSLTSTQLVFFDEFCVKQFCGPPSTSQVNEFNFFFQETKKGKWTWKEVFMKRTINQRKQPLNTSKRDDSVSEWLR